MTASIAIPIDPPDASDTSKRFMLPEDSPYLANLAALWANDADLAARIESLEGQPLYTVQPSKSGLPTLSIIGPDGKPVWLHSRYEPMAEATSLAAGTEPAKFGAFHVFGFGLGYHVEQLAEQASEEAILFIYEPDLRLLRTAFFLRDYSRLLQSRRVHFLTRPDKAELIDRLQPYTVSLFIGAGTLTHSPSLKLNDGFHQQMQAWITEFGSYATTTLNTVLLNSGKTLENIAKNIGWYVSTPNISELKDRYAGKPAVIVSAGPSLRKNKHLLKEVEGKAVIVAVQTTFQPLMQMGVEPDFVTSLDYHEISTRFFENLPHDTNRPIRTRLVAEPKAASAVLAMHPGPVSIIGNAHAESLLREVRPNKASLPAGATVAHLAFYLAEHLGCDPIIFIGQDLGFSDGLCYTPGTSYEDVWRPELGRFCTVEMKQWDQIVRERFILRRIPDQQRRPMYTEERLFTYLQQFERDFLSSKRTIIDATEGGAAKRGTKVMTLAEALAAHCREPLPVVPVEDSERTEKSQAAAALESLRRRRDEAERVESISRETLPLLEEIRDNVQDQDRVNRLIAKIDGLRVKMNELGATYDLISQLDQRSQLDRFKADRKLTASKMDPYEKQRRQVERDINNVRGMLEAATRFVQLMDEVIGQLAGTSEITTRKEAA